MKPRSRYATLRVRILFRIPVFAIFEATDIPTNLHVALDHFKEQITSLQSTLWRYNESSFMYNLILNDVYNNTGKRDCAYFCPEIMPSKPSCSALQEPQVNENVHVLFYIHKHQYFLTL